MSTKKVLFLMVVILGLVWWYYHRPRTLIQGTHQEQKGKISRTFRRRQTPAPEPVQKTPQIVQQDVFVQKKSAQPTSPLSSGRGLVEFVVPEKNLAVAFGDVVLGQVHEDKKVQKGVAEAQRTRLWPSSIIPYAISSDVTNKDVIEKAIAQFHQLTPIRFVPETGQNDLIVFVGAQNLCASYLGRVGGPQPIYLSPGCGEYEVRHELMHALGFIHEHSRVDRDQYVEVLWDHIDPQYWLQFAIVPEEYIHNDVGSVFTFDSESMMLYESEDFAKKPGLVTLRSRAHESLRPSRSSFSRRDLERLNTLYGY